MFRRPPPFASAARRALALSLALLLAAPGARLLAGCAGSADANRTRVARVRPVERTGVADYDEFFAVVYQMQVALNEFERVRITALGDLAEALRLPPTADLEAIGAALHDRSLELAEHGVRVLVERSHEEHLGGAPPRVGGPGGGRGPEVFPQPQSEAAAHAAVEVGTEGEAPVPPEAGRLLTTLRTTLRNAVGLRNRMEEIVTYTPQILAAGRTLAAGVDQRAPPPARDALRAEFRDALEFLTGAGPRARAQAQISQRIVVRLRASANAAPAGE